eukprot:3151681-Rhodomonas_salina.3
MIRAAARASPADDEAVVAAVEEKVNPRPTRCGSLLPANAGLRIARTQCKPILAITSAFMDNWLDIRGGELEKL